MASTAVPSRPVSRTRNDLPEETRSQMIELLNLRLADCIDLQTQTKQAHWNVKGMDFFQLHELFDTLAKVPRKQADLIAVRSDPLADVRVLGPDGRAPAELRCRLPPHAWAPRHACRCRAIVRCSRYRACTATPSRPGWPKPAALRAAAGL